MKAGAGDDMHAAGLRDAAQRIAVSPHSPWLAVDNGPAAGPAKINQFGGERPFIVQN